MGKLLPNGRNSFGRCLTRQDFKINMRKMDEDGFVQPPHSQWVNHPWFDEMLVKFARSINHMTNLQPWCWCQSFCKDALGGVHAIIHHMQWQAHTYWEPVQPLSGTAFQTNKGPSPLSGFAFLSCRRSVQDLCHLQFFLLNQLSALEWGAEGSHCFPGSRDSAA